MKKRECNAMRHKMRKHIEENLVNVNKQLTGIVGQIFEVLVMMLTCLWWELRPFTHILQIGTRVRIDGMNWIETSSLDWRWFSYEFWIDTNNSHHIRLRVEK